MKALQSVRDFHKLFDHPVVDKPAIPSPKRCALRVSLLAEELKELQEAIDNNDIVEATDAFADLQYVLAGAIHEFGLGNIFPAAFDEVHRSNMSKACSTVEEAEATIKSYEEKEGPCHYFSKEVYDFSAKDYKTVYIVARDSDDKTLKSINYSPANLQFIKEGL